MIQVNRIYLIFNRLVTKKFLVDTSVFPFKTNETNAVETPAASAISFSDIFFSDDIYLCNVFAI